MDCPNCGFDISRYIVHRVTVVHNCTKCGFKLDSPITVQPHNFTEGEPQAPVERKQIVE